MVTALAIKSYSFENLRKIGIRVFTPIISGESDFLSILSKRLKL